VLGPSRGRRWAGSAEQGRALGGGAGAPPRADGAGQGGDTPAGEGPYRGAPLRG
jgi:hypothetical protein